MIFNFSRALGSALSAPFGSLCRPPNFQKIVNTFQRESSASGTGQPSSYKSSSVLLRGLQFSAVIGLAINLLRHHAQLGNFRVQSRHLDPVTCIGKGLLTSRRYALPPSQSVEEYEKVAFDAYKGQDTCSSQSGNEDSKTNEPSFSSQGLAEIESTLEDTYKMMGAVSDTHLGVEMIIRGDDQQGVLYLERASKVGHAEAIYNLGVYHQSMQDLSKAFDYFTSAASMGYAAAYYNLAVLHEKGIPGKLESSAVKAIILYQRSYDAGCKEAKGALNKKLKQIFKQEKNVDVNTIYDLARAYHYGLHGIKKNFENAEKLYQVAKGSKEFAQKFP